MDSWATFHLSAIFFSEDSSDRRCHAILIVHIKLLINGNTVDDIHKEVLTFVSVEYSQNELDAHYNDKIDAGNEQLILSITGPSIKGVASSSQSREGMNYRQARHEVEAEEFGEVLQLGLEDHEVEELAEDEVHYLEADED